jgi:hypothetical protein
VACERIAQRWRWLGRFLFRLWVDIETIYDEGWPKWWEQRDAQPTEFQFYGLSPVDMLHMEFVIPAEPWEWRRWAINRGYRPPGGNEITLEPRPEFPPGRPGRIHMRCWSCGRRQANSPRQRFDPDAAVVVELLCPACAEGTKDATQTFYDATGVVMPPRDPQEMVAAYMENPDA